VSRAATLVRWLDLVVLGVALVAFLAAGWPMLGYVVGAVAWLAARAIGVVATRRMMAALAAGDRRSAFRTTAVSTLGRVWLVTVAVLLVGLLGDREEGLAAALLCAGLFTAYLLGEALARLLAAEDER
jgi:succinate-acetate transporter protein